MDFKIILFLLTDKKKQMRFKQVSSISKTYFYEYFSICTITFLSLTPLMNLQYKTKKDPAFLTPVFVYIPAMTVTNRMSKQLGQTKMILGFRFSAAKVMRQNYGARGGNFLPYEMLT